MSASNKKAKSDFITSGVVAQNRRANFDYLIEKTYTAGLALVGTEVKSLRLGHANINDAYGIEKDGELYISNMFIAEYAYKGYESHQEKRDRKLLLKRKEINEIIGALAKKGETLVAIKLVFNERGRAKLIIGLGRGKKLYDKRETIKDRDWSREKNYGKRQPLTKKYHSTSEWYFFMRKGPLSIKKQIIKPNIVN